ncbi:MAG TPA: tetratricopeptide repeat protein [Fimbriimonas sp.]|nr:tetratricopeptide repeat protein [Fimbriimonas sp.]
MKVAVLPFNAAEGTKPAYGRQFAAFAAEQLRVHAQADINAVSFLTQIQEQDGSVRTAFVNVADDLLPYDQLKDLFDQAEVELVMDGMLRQEEDNFDLTVRFHTRESEEPIRREDWKFTKGEIFTILHRLVKLLAEQAEIPLPEALSGDTMEFGSDDADSFLQFLNGFDGLAYIQQANGAVATVFNPQDNFDSLLASIEKDKEFDGPYQVLVQLARACGQYRIGSFEMIEGALRRATDLVPDEWGGYFALGELHQSVGSMNQASDMFEKAAALNPEDPGIMARLGIVQLQLGMPVNAERNFRKAMEKEADDKPSADYLAMVLQQTGRAHEIPRLWKGIVDENPQNSVAYAKYGMALLQNNQEQEGLDVFEKGLETLEDNSVIKRYYAPYLAQKEEYDRAMDFYEDVLDVAPNEVQVLMEYAQTLEAAGREFEVPRVLKDVLNSNPDPNTRAQVMARLIELEQPKRAESVEAAREKMEAGDFNAAISQLKPMRNWLADYWKMWALLSSCYNNLEQYKEAEEAAQKLLELYPGCEPGYGEYVAALTGQGRSEDAYRFMQFAASQNPQSLSIHINLALAAKRAGQTDEARQLAKQIREAIGPNEELEPVLAEIEG